MESLTVNDAREVLAHFKELLTRHESRPPRHHLPDLLDRALSLVRDQSQLTVRDVELLEQLAVEMAGSTDYWSHASTIAHRIRGHTRVRHRLYHFDAERILRGEESTTIGGRALEPEDWEWLRNQARGGYASLPGIWWEVFHLAGQARSVGLVSGTDWETLVSEVEGHIPGARNKVAEARRRRDEEEARRHKEREELEAREPNACPLADVVRTLLAREGVSDARRMPELGILCFYNEVRRDHITGDWDDLPDGLQARVLEACRSGLETGQPGPLAHGNQISARTLGEAAAFDRLARSDGADKWLTDDLIRKWLLIALHGLWSSESWPDLIRACWSSSRLATEQALAGTADDQVRRSEQPLRLGMIPDECWDGALAERVMAIINDDTVEPRVRQELLELLSSRGPELALPRAEVWARRPRTDQGDDLLRQGGLNVLLCHDPVAALNLIEHEFAARGRECLAEIHVLSNPRRDLHADWKQWSLNGQERLAALLLQAYPCTEDEKSDDSPWGGDLSYLRDTVVMTLVQGPETEYGAAKDRLAAIDPNVRQIVAAHRASHAAALEIAVAQPAAAADPTAVPLSAARHLLDRRDFRLIRSADDLLDAVLFALVEVQQEVGHDLPLLYGSPAAAKRTKVAKKGKSERTHLQEDALQAYLRRRLKDVFCRIAERVDVQLAREEEGAYRRRLDLKVTAPCLGTQQQAVVVVEIKWSDNPETRSSLVEQLGEDYLLHEGRTHGVFLVGWSGWWHPGNRQRRSADVTSLKEFLRDQRDSFCAAGEPGEHIRIEPFILDLCWRPEQ